MPLLGWFGMLRQEKGHEVDDKIDALNGMLQHKREVGKETFQCSTPRFSRKSFGGNPVRHIAC